MKYADPIVAAVVLALRLICIPLREAPLDWIVVLALFWAAQSLMPPESRARRASVVVAGLWLTAIYAIHQGPFTWALICSV